MTLMELSGICLDLYIGQAAEWVVDAEVID